MRKEGVNKKLSAILSAITSILGGSEVRKASEISLSVIILLAHLLFVPPLGAFGHDTTNGEGEFSSDVFQKGDKTARLVDLPGVAREKIIEQLRRTEYKVSSCESTLPSGKSSAYRAFNRKQNLNTYFSLHGIHLLPSGREEPTWHLEMNLSAYGYEGAVASPGSVRLKEIAVSGSRLEYRRGGLTEWYVNVERGIEQGVTLSEPPAGEGEGPLVVEWTVSGSLAPRLEQQGRAIAFFNTGGESVLRYSGLKAWDAAGRSLPAKLAVRTIGPEDRLFRIAHVIDAAGACYPVMIDPLFTQTKKLLPGGAADDWFGYSVSISGDTVVVGAYADDDKGSNSGSAYIFERDHGGADNWGKVTKIIASDGAADDWFGYSVSISGDTVVVGAFQDDDKGSNSGSAYIFERDHFGADNWGQVTKIIASDGAADDYFGYSVSISGDTVVVGAFQDDDKGSNSGSAYIFERDHGGADNWGEVTKITASDGAADDYFGYSVSISGDTVVVGAYADDDKGSASGSAYIFDRDHGGADNWGEVTKITASDGAADDYFGCALSISGDTVVVGACGDDDNGSASGSAYIFERDHGGADNWGEVTKIIASDGAADDYFGLSVSISGGTVIVGAYGDDDNASLSGSAYIFERDQGGADNWGEVTKIIASDGAADDHFGLSVSISGDTVVVGAYGDDDNASLSGSAYIFDRDQGGADNWGEVSKITGSDGAANDMFGYSVSVSGDTAVVGAHAHHENGIRTGCAYIFDRNHGGVNNWGQVKKITASDGTADDWFGYSVSISGDTVVVGARYKDSSGCAYIFERDYGGADNWGQVAKITSSDGRSSDWFGVSVSISGDTVVVGAEGDDDNGSGSGSAYIFYRDHGGADNWGEVTRITASDGAAGDIFGDSVSISGDTVVVGARWDDDNGDKSGSAYIFDRNHGGVDEWGEVTKITASDGAADDWFSRSLSISGDTVVVGAEGDDDNGDSSGSAYIFERDYGGANKWGQVTKITASDATSCAGFGTSVSISGDTVVVGAILGRKKGITSGSAYIFDRNKGGANNWGQVKEIAPSDGAFGDQFGISVSISGDRVVVGAHYDNDNGCYSGSAYIFRIIKGIFSPWLILLLLGD